MSKIYEALRQAEADRAKNAGSASSSNDSSQAVLDSEAAPDPAFTPEVRAFEPLGPTIRSVPERTLGGALAEVTPTERSFRVEDTRHVVELPLGGASFDLEKVPQYTWEPVFTVLPALEERGGAVEQFRSLRSRMQEFRDLNQLKTILVSSGLPQEGKSFIAVNMAISFARHKAARVLLIDGDMRRATLHKLLGAPQGPGLTDYLAGTASIEQVLQRPKSGHPTRPVPAGLSSLFFLPSGVEHEKAADLSGSNRFGEMLATLAPHFDWIIVDSSPVNLVSDGVNLARACDGVLLVTRAGVTKYEVAQRAVAELKASKVLGVVLNAIKDQTLAGGYYGYDGYDGYDKQEE
ncbi:MAG TPA: CpsD/CapB family tyrosine-protein kinase [Acidobacteriaceae bacterium]|nr:CpsD/CapB family tyrosine-protein kinase [Acidobacteriaceae bacterium]